MRPSRVSTELRRIASGIDRCKGPVQPGLVSRDLRRVLAAMGDKAKIELRTHEGEGGEEKGGEASITFPDGSAIEGSWRVEGGKGRGMELKENRTDLTDEQAVSVLDAAHDLYWEGEDEPHPSYLMMRAGVGGPDLATNVGAALIEYSAGGEDREKIPPEMVKKLEDMGYVSEGRVTDEGEEYMRSRGIL